LVTLGAQLARAYPAVRNGWSLRAAVLRDEAMKKAGLGLFALFGPAVVLLLIACSNVANLLLARATYREREVAVRATLGATRLRLVRERFAETVWIAGAAGVLGLCLAACGVQLVSVWIGNLEPDVAVPLNTALDGRACLFALAVTLVTPLLFGLFPAIQGSRTDLNKAMRAAGRRSQGRRQYSGRDLLVIVEMALAVILVVASTLFVALFWELGHFERGFDSLHVLAANLPQERPTSTSCSTRPRRCLESQPWRSRMPPFLLARGLSRLNWQTARQRRRECQFRSLRVTTSARCASVC
jgi:predicted lysophospholipase L1 biosynthesis ABC-type transport system permease subunit